MLDLVPDAVKACPQWLVYRKVYNEKRGKWDKLPISAISGHLCDVTSPASWSSCEQACAAVAQFGASHNIHGCGFVLGYNSGIVGIDLDNVLHSDGRVASELNLAIADKLQSYTELSPSRTGLHVLCSGHFEGGRRANGVEVYGQGRFFTMTGEPFGAPRPLAMRQTEIVQLIGEIDELRADRNGPVLDWSIEPKMDDRTVYDMARTADNGAKFLDLWEGRWHLHYPSQSEADFSLVNMLGFYSDAPTQISRMFRYSALGQRDKVDRPDYMQKLIARSQDRKVPLVTLNAPPVIAPPIVDSRPVIHDEDAEEAFARGDNPFTTPDGFLNDLSQWFYAQSIYPMEELSIVAAIGMIAGIIGRQYQFQSGGLNLYMMLLANTGTGKEAMSLGVSRIFDAVVTTPPVYDTHGPAQLGFPAAKSFQGPARLSGKGLLRDFAESSSLSMISVLPEFSQTMTSMAAPNANEGLRDFQAALLEFYTKSAEGATYGGAKNADAKKDIGVLSSPAFTMICEGTPRRFYDALTETMITDGLLSRFIIIEREKEPEYNPNFTQFSKVPDHIKNYITQLCQHVLQLKSNGDVRIHVGMTPDAEEYSERLRAHYRAKGVASNSEITRYLWMRVHQNACRIAAIVAVSANVYQPTVTAEHLRWANRIVYRQTVLIIGKFKRGEVGKADFDEGSLYEGLASALDHWINGTGSNMSREAFVQARAAGLVPYSWLHQRLANMSAYRKDKRGATRALQETIKTAEQSGTLTRARLAGSEGSYYKITL